MLYKKTFVAILVGLLFAGNNLFAQVLPPSKEAFQNAISLNGTWKFKYFPASKMGADSNFYRPDYDLKTWSNIKVPGNWELQGFAEPSYGNKLKDGTGLYQTTFTVPASWKNDPVYIAFDGVSNGYTFWVNGRPVGEFSSAFNRQTFDISQFIVSGQANTLAVKVVTHLKGYEFDTNDDWSLSGIFRDVTLFSLSPVHIQDVIIKTFVRAGSASLDIQAAIEKTAQSSFPAGLNFTGQLMDASGKLVKEFALTGNKTTTDVGVIRFAQRFDVPNPKLWSAETPYLYTLRLALKNGTAPLQQYTEKVGIREVTWADGVLKLNGSPIKLKGVNHHDLSPVNGRSISDVEIMKDLVLMQQGNINFIRTCHYPPQPRMLELCDSMGIYVLDEVPYGYGDELLKDTSYLPNLLLRAKATIWRDKNRPCVIAWSVGNENPVTPIGLTTGRYVKSLDATRPYCFPQTPGVIRDMLKAMPDSLDMLDFHYPKVAELRKLAQEIDRPMIASEYAHALGLDFGSFEESYEIMQQRPKLAGGAVWGFFDQGILRKTTDKTAKGQPTIYAWASKDSIYDTGGNQGTDGIIYADRTPQVDYFHVRKVYTPVKALDDTFTYKPGKSTLQVKMVNRYDFTNLSTLQCKWQLLADNLVTGTGLLPLSGKPHDTLTTTIAITLPPKPVASYYYLKLYFTDRKKYQLYEKTYLIQLKESGSVLNGMAAGVNTKPVKTGEAVVAANYRFEFAKNSGGVRLTNKAGEVLIANGPFARVGKKPSTAQEATTSSNRSKVLHTIWTPFLVTKPATNVKKFTANDLLVNYTYQPDSLKERSISGDIDWQFSDSGYVTVNYRLLPEGKEEAVETGLSFLIPSSLTEFRWAGKGPYAAYPGKDRQSEFGLYHLNSNDLYFAGNRQNVSVAVFTNEKGAGFALIAKDANIAVERTNEGIVVSHNAHVSGTFNKYEWPQDMFSFKEGKPITGSFTIVPLTSSSPALLKNLFGDLVKPAKAFQPFFNSYDQ